MLEKKFNVTRNENGEVIGIEFNAEAFIIPNHSGKLENFWFSGAANCAKEIAINVLGEEPDKDELYVQMWYVVKDLKCDNLVDHNAYIDIDGKKYAIDIASCFLPYTALKGKNDGDIIDVTFQNTNGWRNDDGPEETEETITMHVTLNQKDYRYSSFGSFQEVLNKVTQ